MHHSLPHQHGDTTQWLSLEHSLTGSEHFQVVADIFKYLSDPSRVRIFWLLCHMEACVTNLSAMMDMSSPAVSHHLHQLKASHLITGRREGKEVHYKAADTELSHLLHLVIEQTMAISCPSLRAEDTADANVAACTESEKTAASAEPSGVVESTEANITHMARMACIPRIPTVPVQAPVRPPIHEPLPSPVDTSIMDMSTAGTSTVDVSTVDMSTGDASTVAGVPVETIRRIHDDLMAHLDRRVTIESQARKYLMNTTTLKSAFKAVYGVSIATHMTRHRMERAATLLSDTESTASVAAIARAVGYISQSKFAAAFQKTYGVTPREYRKRARGGGKGEKRVRKELKKE